jgi:hypothetical protein
MRFVFWAGAFNDRLAGVFSYIPLNFLAVAAKQNKRRQAKHLSEDLLNRINAEIRAATSLLN